MTNATIPDYRENFMVSDEEFDLLLKEVLTRKEDVKQIVEDLPSQSYHEQSHGVSKSDLDQVHRSVQHYVSSKFEEREETEAMALGSLVHTIVLEPEQYNERYIVAPEVDKRTKEGKEAYKAFEETIGNKKVIKSELLEQAANMKAAIMNCKTAVSLIQAGKSEVSFFSTDEQTRILKKCRPDLWIKSRRILVDLKTCNDASPNEWRRQIVNYNYDKQAAYYLDTVSEVTGEKYDTFIFICVEKKAPYGVAVYMVNDAVVEAGRELYRRDLNKLSRSLEEKIFTAYPDMIQPIDMATFGFDIESR